MFGDRAIGDPVGHGFVLHIGADERGAAVAGLLGELREVVTDPRTPAPMAPRLFPVVHPDHPDQEAEYQRLMRDELVASRLGAIDTVDEVLLRPGRKVTLDDGRDGGVHAGRQQRAPGARHRARRHRGRRPNDPAERASIASSTCTATCRGCSTRRSGSCRASSERRPSADPGVCVTEIAAGAATVTQTPTLGVCVTDIAAGRHGDATGSRTWEALVEGSGSLLTSRCSQLDAAPAPIV